jgi:PAS domain S-box-containing protein
MSDARRTKADLIAELDSLRARVADLSADADAAASTRKILNRLETRYNHALQNARAMIAEIDEKGVLTHVSPTLSQLLGYLPEEVLNKPGFEWLHEEDRGDIEDLHRQHLVSDESARVVYRARHKAGHWVWLETTGTAHRASDGSSYTIAFTRDITELKRADEALRESEARHRQLAENASDLIAEVDAKGRLLFIGTPTTWDPCARPSNAA